MYIKQIIIEGFKSYKEQQALDEFSPRINVVVGANGSGKSNFFHAIRFVLNDIFTSLRPEDRQKLLHEGAGHAVMSAFVEVVFDNSDNRLPVDKEEVRLRRTIGLKKDEYQLDKKHITKTEVMQLLETAGFSRANPYNVVQQGKITAMATMSDQQRLEMLKEIGGTKIYEDRRRESLKILHDTDNRRNRINEMLSELEGRLKELDAERQELAKFQSLDKQRRSLEYAIYDKEITETRDKLAEVEAERVQEAERGARAAEEAAAAREQLVEVQREVAEVTAAHADAGAKRAAAEKTRGESVKKRARLELDVKELEERRVGNAQTQRECKKELKKLVAELASREAQLQQARAAAQTSQAEEDSLASQIADIEHRLQVLYSKQGRSSQFKTKAERNAWLKSEAGRLEAAQEAKQAAVAELQEEAARCADQLEALAQERSAGDIKVQEIKGRVAEAEARCKALVRERDAANDERKEAWRGADEAEAALRKCTDRLRACESQMERAVARDIQRGLAAVRRLTQEHNISGVHGVLVELFDCIPQLYTAVDVSAGNALFQMVVDTDDVATRLVSLLNKEKAGRVTFIPLNRINPEDVRYPTSFGTDAVPLISHLKFDRAKFDKAMRHVFGKTLVCKDLDIATEAGRATDLNCVTIEGDQVGKKGTLTGGFLDAHRSKMDAMKAVVKARSELEAQNAALASFKAASSSMDEKVTRICKELATEEATLKHLKQEQKQAEAEVTALGKRHVGLQKDAEARERRLKEAASSIAEVARQIADVQAEAATDLHAQLSPGERSELARLNPQLGDLKERRAAAKRKAVEAAAELEEVELDLSSNLRKRKAELEERLAAASTEVDSSELEEAKVQLEAAQREVAAVTAAEASAAEALEEAGQKLRQLKAEAERLRELQDSGDQRAQDEAKALERLLLRRAQLQQKKSDLEKKVRELGSLPAQAFEGYQDSSLPSLHRTLQKVQGQIKKLGNVNKKALDQYMSFVEERDDVAKRQAENVKSDASIRQLITTLDMRREEAIERTFKGVAKNFREIFKELEPNGRGELVMQLRANTPEAEDAGPPEQTAGLPAHLAEPGEKYTGVKVKVSFGGRETLSMKQLSGGQKTLVALALIFAIQRCDPAPFYLFDEIDAALDQHYRASVAHMIARQASDTTNPAQFIITTFHPQIVMEADKVYGVSHSNRLSHVDLVTREDALEFVMAEQVRARNKAQPPPEDTL